MIIKRITRLRPKLVVKCEDRYYVTFWDRVRNKVCALNADGHIFAPLSSTVEIVGEVGVNFIQNDDGSMTCPDYITFDVNDVYEIKKGNKVVDCFLISDIEGNKYHVIYKHGKTAILSLSELILMGFKPQDKKLLGIQYEIRRA